jgi:hypothetical protein
MNEPSNQVQDVIRKAFNNHGYPFQHSVLRRGEDCYRAGKSRWYFSVAELPVEVRGSHTRVDFVLEHRDQPWLLVAECKRVNPALASWCFAKAPYWRRDHHTDPLTVEVVHRSSFPPAFIARPATLAPVASAVHVFVEAPTPQIGDSGHAGRGAIEAACTQVTRSAQGLVEFFADSPGQLPEGQQRFLLPVVFTTAALWLLQTDLSTADVETGLLPQTVVAVSVPWVWLQYPVSKGIQHTKQNPQATYRLGEALEKLYVRTIAVVSAPAVEDFLSVASQVDSLGAS